MSYLTGDSSPFRESVHRGRSGRRHLNSRASHVVPVGVSTYVIDTSRGLAAAGDFLAAVGCSA
jgi:hypothetical protein